MAGGVKITVSMATKSPAQASGEAFGAESTMINAVDMIAKPTRPSRADDSVKAQGVAEEPNPKEREAYGQKADDADGPGLAKGIEGQDDHAHHQEQKGDEGG